MSVPVAFSQNFPPGSGSISIAVPIQRSTFSGFDEELEDILGRRVDALGQHDRSVGGGAAGAGRGGRVRLAHGCFLLLFAFRSFHRSRSTSIARVFNDDVQNPVIHSVSSAKPSGLAR